MNGEVSPEGRSLRSDPHFASARAVTEAGDVGAPRTLRLGWSFPNGTDPVAAASELTDVASWLLDTDPASLYALAADDDGPPLLHINLLASNGALALLKVSIDAAGFPAQREIHLLGADGEIVHRTGQDDLLWSDRGCDAFTAPAPLSANDERGKAPRRVQAIARALTASLASGEPVIVTEENAR